MEIGKHSHNEIIRGAIENDVIRITELLIQASGMNDKIGGPQELKSVGCLPRNHAVSAASQSFHTGS